MREGGFRNIGGLAQRLTSVVAKGRGTSIARLRVDWPTIVGPELARTTQPDALLAGRSGRTGGKALRLRVAGAAALEVQHMRGQLIERVNAYFGHRAIEDIRLIQGAIAAAPPPRVTPKPDPATIAAIESRVAAVKDPELRAALVRLGARVAMNRRSAILGILGAFAAAREPRAQNDLLAIRPYDHVLGKPEAPIVIVEYASLTCWSCARFHTEVLPPVKRRWIDSGKAKLVFRHFPFDNIATRMSQITECGTPANFFPTLETMFRTQDRWARAPDPAGEMAKILAGFGFTRQTIEACYAHSATVERVIEDVLAGQTLGVTSTPTLFINGQNHDNPGDPDAIDAILRKVGR